MNIRLCLPLLAALLLLSHPVFADKVHKSSDAVTVKVSDDFAKSESSVKGTTLELYSEKQNAQILVGPASGGSSRDQFVKAFPVLADEKKLTILGGPVKLTVAGADAVYYELGSTTVPGIETVYAYVGRKGKPYSVIFNYPSPRSPQKVKAFQSVLSTIKH